MLVKGQRLCTDWTAQGLSRAVWACLHLSGFNSCQVVEQLLPGLTPKTQREHLTPSSSHWVTGKALCVT